MTIVPNPPLTEDSPRVDQDSLTYVPSNDSWSSLEGSKTQPKLWPHQCAGLFECSRLEIKPVQTALQVDNDVTVDVEVEYRVGVLCDPPGCGKTAIMAHLLGFFDIPDSREIPSIAALGGLALCYPHEPIVLDKCSMVVVSHNIISQWQNTFDGIGMRVDVDYKIVHNGWTLKRKHPEDEESMFMEVINDAFSGKYRVILISNNAYGTITKLRPDLALRVSLQRMVIDEADSISIPNFVLMPSRFLWMVTATANCFKCEDFSSRENRGHLRHLANCMKIPRAMTGSKYTYAFNYQRIHDAVKEQVFVRCDPDFIAESLNLPPVNMIRLEKNAKLNMLREKGIITNSTQQQLETNTHIRNCGIPWAMVGVTNINPDLNSLYSMEVQLNRVKVDRVNFLNQMSICAMTLKTLDASTDTIIKMPCCNVNVDGRALAFFADIPNDGRCPACRIFSNWASRVNLSEVNRMTKEEIVDVFQSMCTFDIAASTIKNMEPHKRILVFVEKSNKGELATLFKQKDIDLCMLQGKQSFIKKLIGQFERREKRVLVLGDKQGQGHNLHMADVLVFLHSMAEDRFKQMVGRGQRPGRTESLVVYHMQSDPNV